MKKIVLGIVIGLIIGLSSTVIASSLIASQIGYTPKDNTWGVNNVEAAIDSLKLSKTSDNYSTDEKVVGTWIDGKPLYQKTLIGDIIPEHHSNLLNNIDTVVNAYGETLYNNTIWFHFPYHSGNAQVRWELVDNNVRATITGYSENILTKYKWTFQYTKTTD